MADDKKLANAILEIETKANKLSKLAEIVDGEHASEEDFKTFNMAVKELEQARKKYTLLQKENQSKK